MFLRHAALLLPHLYGQGSELPTPSFNLRTTMKPLTKKSVGGMGMGLSLPNERALTMSETAEGSRTAK